MRIDYQTQIAQTVKHIMTEQNNDNSPLWHSAEASRLDLRIAQQLADYHDTAGHNLPAVCANYSDFIARLMSQYRALLAHGFVIEPAEASAGSVNNSQAIFERLDNTGRIAFYRTDIGFGSGNATNGHPMLASAGIVIDGYSLCYNDIFRAVHDLLGHYHIRSSFSPLGEYRAFVAHCQLFNVHSPAITALMLETIIPSSWFECGRHIRRPDNTLPGRQDNDFIPYRQRPFAISKVYKPRNRISQLLPLDILTAELLKSTDIVTRKRSI